MINIEYLEKFQKIEGDNYQSEKRYTKRIKYASKYAWAIPTNDALKKISKYGSLIEIGAGTGYWGYLLNQIGVDILCFDIKPYDNHYVNNNWFDVKVGNPETIKKYSERNLFMCWVPFDNTMGFDCLKNFTGKYVIYIGEGRGGCNMSHKGWSLLRRDFDEIEHINIPNWVGFHDFIKVFKRNDDVVNLNIF